MTITALILAGGRATRLGGVDKAELVVDAEDGRTIFERQVAALGPRTTEIVVAGPARAGYRSVADAVAGAGPLAGIAAGLAAATTPWVLVVAGDMPELRGEVIDLLVSGADAPDTDAVAFQIGGYPEPLLCLLARAPALAAVERLLADRTRKASRLLTDAGLRVTWIDEARLRAVDPELRSLANVNEPADLAREREKRGFSPGSRSGTN